MGKRAVRGGLLACALLLAGGASSIAGPPYVSDDPEPTDEKQFEIYAFASGTRARAGADGVIGMDFNYGAARDLQLTAVVPLGWNAPRGGPITFGLANVELAAKYRFLHQQDFGVDVAFFPRIILPAGTPEVGERHVSYLLPFWVERTRGAWSTFGGAGCTIKRGEESRSFCQMGWALTNQMTPRLEIGTEVYHESPDTRDGLPSTGIGLGAIYDLSDTYHLLGSIGPGIQNAGETSQAGWYVAFLSTFSRITGSAPATAVPGP